MNKEKTEEYKLNILLCLIVFAMLMLAMPILYPPQEVEKVIEPISNEVRIVRDEEGRIVQEPVLDEMEIAIISKALADMWTAQLTLEILEELDEPNQENLVDK